MQLYRPNAKSNYLKMVMCITKLPKFLVTVAIMFSSRTRTRLCITFIFIIVEHAHSQCSNLNTNPTLCEVDGYCLLNQIQWNQTDCICGQIQWNQDIAFIFDSSMTSLQWSHSNQFASDLLYYASPSTTTARAAILQTGDAFTASTVTLSFGDETLSNTIESTLPNLSQSHQSAFYLQNALQDALALFNASSPSTHRKLLIIFASQPFSQSPCKVNMRTHEISTYTIAIGDFNKYPLICVGSSENNYEGLITSITDAADLWSILPKMEQILCPHHPLFKVTEIQFAGANGEQYLEIYNYGHDIDDMSQLHLTHIASGTLNTVASPSWTQGSVAVIYNRDNVSIPNCVHCSCTESILTASSTIKWCADVIYIGCCDACDCQWNDGLSMTAFSIGLVWINPHSLIRYTESITFDIGEQWPVVGAHYALELKYRGYNNQFGSSWTMSCAIEGTPGDTYLSTPCVFDCAVDGTDLCDLNNGMATAQCNSASCNCLDGYYAHYHTCLPLPVPSNCIATALTSSASNTAYEIAAWDGDTTYVYFHCEEPLGCVGGAFPYAQTTTSLLNPIVFDPGRDTNATLIALQAIDIHDNVWVSDTTTCNHVTDAPTLHPTLSPTFMVPTVPSCSVILSSDLTTFQVVWTPIDMQLFGDAIPPNDTFFGYVYYYNNQRRSTPSSCCIMDGSPLGSRAFDMITPDEVSVSGDWDSTGTDITPTDELLSATLCGVITQEPTISPTKSPTWSPTPQPTINPTTNPTLSPTLEELFVPKCSATVLGGSNTLNVTWIEAKFGPNTPSKVDTRYAIEWVYNDGNVSDPWYVSATQDGRSTKVVVDNYQNMLWLHMYCTWSSFTQRGRSTNCSLFTVTPTVHPTPQPSVPPTPSPLSIPTTSPTNRPSAPPTMAPTFIVDDLSWCHAVFHIKLNKDTVTLIWGLLTVNDTDPSTTPSDWITYIAHIGNGSTVISVEHTAAEVCDKTDPTQCWGQTQKILSDADDVSTVTLRADAEYNGNVKWTTNTIECTIGTMQPTSSPTVDPTSFPTLSPTFGDVSVYLDNTACVEDARCGCPYNISSECCSVSDCDWVKYPAPIIVVSEKSNTNTTFYVRRTESLYPYAISVQFNIYAVNESLAQKYGFYTRIHQMESGDFSLDYLNDSSHDHSDHARINYTIPSDCYFTEWDLPQCDYYISEDVVRLYPCSGGRYAENVIDTCSWCDFYDVPGPRCNDITPSKGTFEIPFSNVSDSKGAMFEQSTFELSILTDGCQFTCDFAGEVFLLELTQCEVIMDKNHSEETLNCDLIYPSRAYIIVMDQDQASETDIIKIPDDSYDDWLWFVIMGAVVLLSAAAYAGFIMWRNKKMIDSAKYAEVEEEHAPVIACAEDETSLISNYLE
eukprot:885011_1